MFTKTDYDKLEQLMAEKPENRELLTRLLDSFEESTAAISHEIRNPLTLVYSTLQLLESRHPDVTGDRYWTSLCRDVEYMQQLLTDLSSFSHSRSLRLSRFSFRSLMEQIVLSFAASCADTDISFTSKVSKDLPQLEGDPVKLREVFLNLLRNAREAISGKGSIWLEAACVSQDPKDWDSSCVSGIQVTIRDTGCGIEEEQLSRIFEPFVTFKPNGTGLGLAIARRTVRAHGGTLSVSSSEKGTVFSVFLPV